MPVCLRAYNAIDIILLACATSEYLSMWKNLYLYWRKIEYG